MTASHAINPEILEVFEDQINWLYTLVTDPAGNRYFQDKTQEMRLHEFQEQFQRIVKFLDFAGNPHEKFRSIHVAGTSGKSSVTAILAALLSRCGFRTGFHVSPYLQIPNEKLIIDGKMISPSEFVHLLDHFRDLYQSWDTSGGPLNSLNYVEAYVALTFLWFAQQAVEWAVIETGVGGRFDPTNVLNSNIAVITNVNFDHVPILGNTLPEIAYHKAGIIKENGVVITSETKSIVLDVIKKEADQKRAHLYCINQDYHFTVHNIDRGGGNLSVQTPYHQYADIHVPLQGIFQPGNAALAISAIDILAREYNFSFSAEIIHNALNEIHFPGRIEVISHNPKVILDGAHNPHKMQALVESIQAIYPGKKITVIFGALATKDVSAMVHSLSTIGSSFILTKSEVVGKPALEPEQLADILHKISPGNPLQIVENAHEAIDIALEKMGPGELLLITGSIYLIGEARNYWFPKKQILLELEKKEPIPP